jgi:hypothetical protein
MTMEYPLSLIELHVTFAYTSPPPALLLTPRHFLSPAVSWGSADAVLV